LARVGRAGSFFECLAGSRAGFCFGAGLRPCWGSLGAFGSSGAFAIAEIWRFGYDGKRAEHGSAGQFLMRMLAAHPTNGLGCRRASGNGGKS
jgi:hypothetical protein